MKSMEAIEVFESDARCRKLRGCAWKPGRSRSRWPKNWWRAAIFAARRRSRHLRTHRRRLPGAGRAAGRHFVHAAGMPSMRRGQGADCAAAARRRRAAARSEY